MESKSVHLRLVSEADLQLLYDWANDPITRANSFHTDPISYETHNKWFRKMLSDENILQFILMNGDIPIGQARLSIHGDEAQIGYSISPDYRGLGYGRLLCQLLINKVKGEYPFLKRLKAQVKPENVASLHCFQKCGFTKTFVQYELDVEAMKPLKVDLPQEKLGGGGTLPNK